MFPAHLGNDAEGARVVATLGDFHIGKVFGGQTPAGRVEVGDVDGEMVGDQILRRGTGGASQDATDHGSNLLELVQTDEGIDFREFTGKFRREPLGHASGDDETLIGSTAVQSAIPVGFENGGNAFRFGGINESTGIDDEDVGLGGIRGQIDAGRPEVAQHDFRVDEVFGATQGNQADFGSHEGKEGAPWRQRAGRRKVWGPGFS